MQIFNFQGPWHYCTYRKRSPFPHLNTFYSYILPFLFMFFGKRDPPIMSSLGVSRQPYFFNTYLGVINLVGWDHEYEECIFKISLRIDTKFQFSSILSKTRIPCLKSNHLLFVPEMMLLRITVIYIHSNSRILYQNRASFF